MVIWSFAKFISRQDHALIHTVLCQRRTSPGCKGEVAQYEGLTRYFVVNNKMGFLVGQRRKSFLSPVKRSMENPEKGLLLLAEARQAQSRTHRTHKGLRL